MAAIVALSFSTMQSAAAERHGTCTFQTGPVWFAVMGQYTLNGITGVKEALYDFLCSKASGTTIGIESPAGFDAPTFGTQKFDVTTPDCTMTLQFKVDPKALRIDMETLNKQCRGTQQKSGMSSPGYPACVSAVQASGSTPAHAEGYCLAFNYSARYWHCVKNSVNAGRSLNSAEGFCLSKL
jgi:hypothetical protein